MGKSIDSKGAGQSWQSPGWLTQLNLLWSGKGVSSNRNACMQPPARAMHLTPPLPPAACLIP